jgi:hypothetical protein
MEVVPNVNMVLHNLFLILNQHVDVHVNKDLQVLLDLLVMKEMLGLMVKMAQMPKMDEMVMFFVVQSVLNLVSSVHQVHQDLLDNLDPRDLKDLREKLVKQDPTAIMELLVCKVDQDIMAHLVHPDYQDPKEKQVALHKKMALLDLLELQVAQVKLAKKGTRAKMVIKDPKANKVNQVMLANPDQRESLAHKVLLVYKDPMDPKVAAITAPNHVLHQDIKWFQTNLFYTCYSLSFLFPFYFIFFIFPKV